MSKSKCRFVALDLETTGLDPQRDQILQIGAVAFDTDGQWHEFQTLVHHDRLEGDPFALQMNAEILKKIAKGEGRGIREALGALGEFVGEHAERRPHPVGFNVCAFDLAFLKASYSEAYNQWSGAAYGAFHHRGIELGTLYLRPDGTPATSEIVRTHLGHEVAHDALQDARDAAELFLRWLKEEERAWASVVPSQGGELALGGI